MSLVDQARALVVNARSIVLLTGAGISTDSGIPDFRGPNGLWTKNPAAERIATLDHYLNEPDVRELAWKSRLDAQGWKAAPNRAHKSIVTLEQAGKLRAVVTQNVDGLHQKAGNSDDRVIEVHGNIHRTMCWSCGDKRPMFDALDRVKAGDRDPACELCGGILKSDTISFGQNLVPEVIEAAISAVAECDLLIAVGTTLAVYPAANLVPQARHAGAGIIILNGQPTAMDSYADVLIHAQIGDTLPAILDPTG